MLEFILTPPHNSQARPRNDTTDTGHKSSGTSKSPEGVAQPLQYMTIHTSIKKYRTKGETFGWKTMLKASKWQVKYWHEEMKTREYTHSGSRVQKHCNPGQRRASPPQKCLESCFLRSLEAHPYFSISVEVNIQVFLNPKKLQLKKNLLGRVELIKFKKMSYCI